MRSTLLVPLFFAICSCSSPPKPPGVDETRRHPVNAAAALDLKRCKNDLQNSKISVAEATAETAALKTWAGQVARQAREYRDGPSQNSAEARNTIYSIPFDFGSVHIAVSSEDVEHLVAGARRAAWIVLSGRTDGASDTIAEGRVARARVEAVRDLLVRYGIEPARIRSTCSPSAIRPPMARRRKGVR